MSHAVLFSWAVAVVAFAVGGPTVLFCLFPRLLRARFDSGPEGIDSRASSAARELIRRLRQMGFEPLGVKAEKAPLRPAARELAFVAGDRRCYASIGLSRAGSTLYFYTPLPDGGLVLTSNGRFPKIESAKVMQRSYPGRDAEALVERHYEALGRLGQAGEVFPTQDARVEATLAYYAAPEVRAVLRRVGVLLAGVLLVLAWVLIRRG